MFCLSGNNSFGLLSSYSTLGDSDHDRTSLLDVTQSDFGQGFQCRGVDVMKSKGPFYRRKGGGRGTGEGREGRREKGEEGRGGGRREGCEEGRGREGERREAKRRKGRVGRRVEGRRDLVTSDGPFFLMCQRISCHLIFF